MQFSLLPNGGVAVDGSLPAAAVPYGVRENAPTPLDLFRALAPKQQAPLELVEANARHVAAQQTHQSLEPGGKTESADGPEHGFSVGPMNSQEWFIKDFCSPPSKWALEARAEASAYELAPFGIDVAIVEPGAFLTDLGKVTGPDDQQRAASHGEYQRIADEARKRIAERAARNDPANVARTIVDLANAAHGERPWRSVVPPNPAVESINSTLSPIQDALLKSLGVDALVPKTRVASLYVRRPQPFGSIDVLRTHAPALASVRHQAGNDWLQSATDHIKKPRRSTVLNW